MRCSRRIKRGSSTGKTVSFSKFRLDRDPAAIAAYESDLEFRDFLIAGALCQSGISRTSNAGAPVLEKPLRGSFYGCARLLKSLSSFDASQAGVAKLVYAPDSKSGEVTLMSVRVRPPAPTFSGTDYPDLHFRRSELPFPTGSMSHLSSQTLETPPSDHVSAVNPPKSGQIRCRSMLAKSLIRLNAFGHSASFG